VDTLCKQALYLPNIKLPINLEYQEARCIYRDHFLQKWQPEWTTSSTGSKLQKHRTTGIPEQEIRRHHPQIRNNHHQTPSRSLSPKCRLEAMGGGVEARNRKLRPMQHPGNRAALPFGAHTANSTTGPTHKTVYVQPNQLLRAVYKWLKQLGRKT